MMAGGKILIRIKEIQEIAKALIEQTEHAGIEDYSVSDIAFYESENPYYAKLYIRINGVSLVLHVKKEDNNAVFYKDGAKYLFEVVKC
jgi:hypothetical protein